MLFLRISKLHQIICDPFFVSALLKGTAAGIEQKSVLQELNFDLIVDVGANRGQFALISRKLFPQAKIHSFASYDIHPFEPCFETQIRKE